MRSYGSIARAAALLPMVVCGTARAATFEPAPVLASDLVIRIEAAGQVGTPGGSTNIASPVAIGGDLYVVDQGTGRITIQDPGGPRVVLDTAGAPAGVTPAGPSKVMNIAGTGTMAYVGFQSSTLPGGFAPAAPLPADARYGTSQPRYDLIYAYDRAPDGGLSNPRPLAAFEATTNGHRGEAMLVLPDGRLLFARGDNLTPTYNGLEAPQDQGSTLGALVIVDGTTGAVEVAAKGLRNVQRMSYDASGETIVFSDIGWTVAEEIDTVAVADLVDTATVENFGWGVAPDGKAREGTFYVNEGPEPQAEATGVAPVPEPGFLQPFAQFGREERQGLFAVTGPVLSETSFTTIGMLFGDLAEGDLYATLAGAGGTLNDVFHVGLLDANGQPTTLQDLFGIARIDLRFFNFADGGAGLMSERTGGIYRITQVATAVPLPASGLLLLLALGGAGALRRRRG